MAGFHSTGAGVSDTLQSILLRRHEQERQASQDALHQQQVEAQIAASQENLALNKMLREAQAQKMKDEAQVKLAKTLNIKQKLDPATAAKLDPSWVETAPQRPNPLAMDPQAAKGPLKDIEGLAPQMTGAEGVVPGALQPPDEKDGLTFKGLPEQQEAESYRNEMLKYLSDPEVAKGFDPDNLSLMRVVVQNPNWNGTLPAGLAQKDRQGHLRIIDAHNGKVIQEIPINGPDRESLIGDRDGVPAGAATAGLFPEPKPELGRDGLPTGRYFTWNKRNGDWLLAKPPADGSDPPTSFKVDNKAYETAKGFLQRSIGARYADSRSRVQAINQARAGLKASVPLPPEFKDQVTKVLTAHPEMATEQVISTYFKDASGNPLPQDLGRLLYDYITLIRAK